MKYLLDTNVVSEPLRPKPSRNVLRRLGSHEGETAIASTTPTLYEKPVFSKNKIRPWLQSFDYPVAYTPAMIEAQIKANEDAGLTSYLFWDAANKYTALRQVLGSSN